MKHSKKNGIYALIAGTAFGLYGCVKEEETTQPTTQPVQRPSPIELKTVEESQYVFDRLLIKNEPFNGFYSQQAVSVTCADLDNDGDLEIIVATAGAIVIYDNNLCENKTEQHKIERE